MAMIDTCNHPATCPYCGKEQLVELEVNPGYTKTATFECNDCGREFEVVCTITYVLDVNKL